MIKLDAVTDPTDLRVQKSVNIIGNVFLRPTMKLQLRLHPRFPALLHRQMHRSLLLRHLMKLVDAVVIHPVHNKS